MPYYNRAGVPDPRNKRADFRVSRQKVDTSLRRLVKAVKFTATLPKKIVKYEWETLTGKTDKKIRDSWK